MTQNPLGCSLKTACDVARSNSRSTGRTWAVYKLGRGYSDYTARELRPDDPRPFHIFRDGKRLQRPVAIYG